MGVEVHFPSKESGGDVGVDGIRSHINIQALFEGVDSRGANQAGSGNSVQLHGLLLQGRGGGELLQKHDVRRGNRGTNRGIAI